ncbi:MAG: hypothetical protein H0T54_05685 [Geodermatophilaceae bacterium]|nr:hypothetical protein [Geodermatophilaceae bacterium]
MESTDTGLGVPPDDTVVPYTQQDLEVGALNPTGSPRAASGPLETGLGTYDGAQAPIFGVLAGLDVSPRHSPSVARLQTAEATVVSEPPPIALATPTLLAALLISVVSGCLARRTVMSRRLKK